MRFKFKLFLLSLLLVVGQTIAIPTISHANAPRNWWGQAAIPSAIQLLAKTSEPSLENADRLFQTGLSQFNQQQFDLAIAAWKQALAIYQSFLPSPSSPADSSSTESADENLLGAIAATQQNLLAVYLKQNRIDEAIALLPQQAQTQQQLGKSAAVATADYTLANLYARKGRYREAIAPYERSLAYAQAHDSQRLPIVLGNLAIAYKTVGELSKALEANQTAIKQLQEQNNQPFLRQVLGNQGNLYQSLGNYTQARESFEAGLNIAEQLGDRSGQALLWNNLGGVAVGEEDYEQATRAYQKSIQLAEESENLASLGSAWLNLGDVSHRQGKLDEAIAHYEKSLAIAEQLSHQSSNQPSNQPEPPGNPRKLMAEALGSLGVAYDSQDNPAKAVELLKNSLAISEAMGDRATTSTTLNNLGHALYKAGELKSSEASLRRALEVLDDLRQGLSDLDKVSLFDTQAKTYLLLQQVLIAQQRPEAALEIAEWGRGRAFADLLVERAIARQERGQTADKTSEETAMQTETLNQILNQTLAQTLAQAAQPPPLEQLRQVARTQQATLVEYSLIPQDDFVHQGKQLGIPEAIYIWVIQPDGQVHFRQSNLKSLSEANQSLEQLVQKARCFDSAVVCRRRLRAVKTRGMEPDPRFEGGMTRPATRSADIPPPSVSPARNSGGDRRQFPALQQLHTLLIEPIADLLPTDPLPTNPLPTQNPGMEAVRPTSATTNRILLIPQGPLFLVPFVALQDAAGEFLIEQHHLSTAPSIQTLLLTEQAQAAKQPVLTHSSSKALIVGNPIMPSVTLRPDRPARPLAPLPGAEVEAKAIAQALGIAPLIGAQASESAVIQALPQARWIHLATHGLLDYGTQTQQKIPGALALAPQTGSNSPDQDGLLTADEILALELQADLVVLSACDTGRGDITGDGVVGLSRAWMAAGAPSLVVSLWAVSDESTAVLMQHFYQALSQGADKATALREAILLTAKDYPNPHDWSAFSLMGQAL